VVPLRDHPVGPVLRQTGAQHAVLAAVLHHRLPAVGLLNPTADLDLLVIDGDVGDIATQRSLALPDWTGALRAGADGAFAAGTDLAGALAGAVPSMAAGGAAAADAFAGAFSGRFSSAFADLPREMNDSFKGFGGTGVAPGPPSSSVPMRFLGSPVA
jgi:hypothetical protein